MSATEALAPAVATAIDRKALRVLKAACATREGGLKTHVEFYGDIGRAAVRQRCLEPAST